MFSTDIGSLAKYPDSQAIQPSKKSGPLGPLQEVSMNFLSNLFLENRRKLPCFFALWALWATSPLLFAAETIVIHGPDALRKALQKVILDTQLKLAPGEYGHGYNYQSNPMDHSNSSREQ